MQIVRTQEQINKYQALKQECKNLAAQIKGQKKIVRVRGGCHYKEIYKLIDLKSAYRHLHIAYCLIRGRSLEQIERPKENNKPNLDLVYKYKAAYEA